MDSYPISTGHDQLDDLLDSGFDGGFDPGTVTFITGAHGTGKSALITDLSVNATIDGAYATSMFLNDQIEDVRTRLITRLIADDCAESVLSAVSAYQVLPDVREPIDWDQARELRDRGKFHIDAVRGFVYTDRETYYHGPRIDFDNESKKVLHYATAWLDNAPGTIGSLHHNNLRSLDTCLDLDIDHEEDRLIEDINHWRVLLGEFLGYEESLIDERYRQFREQTPFPEKPPMIMFVDDMDKLDDFDHCDPAEIIEMLQEMAVKYDVAVVASVIDRSDIVNEFDGHTVIELEARGQQDDSSVREVNVTVKKGDDKEEVTMMIDTRHHKVMISSPGTRTEKP